MQLVFRRGGNVFRLKWAARSGPHRGLKCWPDWLGARHLPICHGSAHALTFPLYVSSGRLPLAVEKYVLSFDPSDHESALATHRWTECLLACLSSEEAAEAALQLALGWMRNPPAYHDAAWEPYSCSERVANLAVMLSVFPDLWKSLKDDGRCLITRFFADSGHWVHDHLEYYGIERTNNHILNNARALVITGSVLGNVDLAGRGLILFSRMARELFQSSGSLRERSSHYQLIVANWLMDVLKFANAVEKFQGEALQAMNELQRLSENVANVANVLMAATMHLQSFVGDLSPDNHPVVSAERLCRLYPERCSSHHEYEGAHRFDDWFVMHNQRHLLMSCVVPADYPQIYTTHGHNDLGGFLWAFDGNAILVDAGRASYQLSTDVWQQCGPCGHNVLLVEGLSALPETLLSNGRWCPVPYSKARIDLIGRDDGFVVGHDGFTRIPGVGNHRRSVTLEKDGILIVDLLDGEALVAFDTLWHFAPALALTNEKTLVAEGGAFAVLIDVDAADAPVTMAWERFPFSIAYGDVQECHMLKVSGELKLPAVLRTRLRIV